MVVPCQDAAMEPGTTMLDWRFGSAPDETKLGYSMQFFPEQEDCGETSVEWNYNAMAVCLIDVDSRHTPVMQHGYMCRLSGMETSLNSS
ncbi:hypothetical protein Esi_0084_0071 [Ectocarpus siliculosus]|uniref:Uncharacterized protein n=1 Tax=Ectocarpus siliculosus TaxID=2880 RepID=D7G7M7_ECTSI|nr:hypothetical protein Esi_0084_0071 [Ectocarpus siliculosus]|eukprot:CBJ27766.1 hypothetical protein Esi_0084_0071 [Ectocarpus siliculosus]